VGKAVEAWLFLPVLTPPACDQAYGRPACVLCFVRRGGGSRRARVLHKHTHPSGIHRLSLPLVSLIPLPGVYGSQMGREDFEPEDIDYYFEYTGSLAVSKERERRREKERRTGRRRLGAASRTYLSRTPSPHARSRHAPLFTRSINAGRGQLRPSGQAEAACVDFVRVERGRARANWSESKSESALSRGDRASPVPTLIHPPLSSLLPAPSHQSALPRATSSC